MYKSLVRRMIRKNVRSLNEGNPEPLLAGYHRDAVLMFPGQSSWGGEHRGKPAIEVFLRRFVESGLKGETHEIVVNGPPWRTTICMRFSSRAWDAGGTLIYDNRAVLFARAKWGKLVYQEDFEDTHKVEAFDRYLADHQPVD